MGRTSINTNLRCLFIVHQFILHHHAGSTSSFDLPFSRMSERPSFHDDRLFRKETFAENFVDTSLNTVNDRCWTFRFLGVVGTRLCANQGPQFINVHCGTMIFVVCLVEMQHTDFTEVTGMVFIEEGSVMMLTSSFTATTRMLSMFTNTTMTSTFVSSLLSVFMQSGRHCASLISVTISSLIFFICPH